MIQLYDIKLEEKAVENAIEVLRSGALRQGPWTERFEKAFAERFTVQHALTVSSGTAALHLALLSLFEPGDEILVPSFTFFATASAVALAGMKPVFCDVRDDTFSLDTDSMSSRLTDKTRGIILVHLFGHPAPVDEIEKFALDHDLKIIHDLAQAHGIRWRGEEVAARGEAACFSFYPTKNILAGEGGMVTTRNAGVAEKIALFRNHGMDRPYHHVLLGFNYRMTDVESAIGLAQLEIFDAQIERRRYCDRVLREALDIPDRVVWQHSPAEGDSVPNLLTGRVVDGNRDEIVLKLREKGVGCGVYYPSPLHMQPVFTPSGCEGEFPVCDTLCKKVFSLPVHHNLSEEDLQTIIRVTAEVLRG